MEIGFGAQLPLFEKYKKRKKKNYNYLYEW